MLPWMRKRRKEAADRIEGLLDSDLDGAAEELARERHRLARPDAARLTEAIQHRIDAREHRHYLTRALAESRITPEAAFELLTTYREAGHVNEEQAASFRRQILDAHRREILDLLGDPSKGRFDYFRAIDAYRAAGHLSEEELRGLEELLDAKLNPGMAARRLFARARTTRTLGVQEDLLHRYLVEFEGFPDYPEAASLYLSLRIHRLWEVLPGIRSARDATLAVYELNNVLQAYVPYTANIEETVPVNRIVHEFMTHASNFKPESDDVAQITEEHLNRKVVVVDKHPGSPGSYTSERNGLVSMGAEGRVKAVRARRVMVDHRRPVGYTSGWSQPAFKGSPFATLRKDSSLAVWDTAELGLVQSSGPSPIFVHQFKEAVHEMASLLERHRTDHAPRLGDEMEAVFGSDAPSEDDG